MIRFTKDVIEKVLAINEGFTDRTYFKSRNKEEENIYSIVNGVLKVRSIGKSSFGGSRYDETEICDLDQTRRFLDAHRSQLNLDI